MQNPPYPLRPQFCSFLCLVCLAFTWPILSIGTAQEGTRATAPPYGSAQDVTWAQRAWPILEAYGLVGPNALRTPYVEAREPVGQWIETMGTMISFDGQTRQAFVKRVYEPVGLPLESLDSDPQAFLEHVVVMIRANQGYNSAAEDWFFVRYDPHGNVLNDPHGTPEAGRLHGHSDIGCFACHRTAPGDDFLFTTDWVVPSQAR